MDQHKFANVVRHFPQVWNRSHPQFRDKSVKDVYWVEIGKTCGGISGTAAKDLFKAMREKYLREREKSKQLGTMYVPWPLLDTLSYLEPHIVLRKQATNYEQTLQAAEELSSSINLEDEPTCTNLSFETALIQLVKKSTPIWNRDSKTFSSKPLKLELWKKIAEKLNKDSQYCILRWKALREKYIRQKIKYQEGEGKWHLLDEMSFLDEVIQYRRRQSDKDSNSSLQNENSFSNNFFETVNKSDNQSDNSKTPQSQNDAQYYDRLGFDSENSTNDYSNDFPVSVKQENEELPDSSNEVPASNVNKKRRISNTSDTEYRAKSPKSDELSPQSQEQLFGNLVAVMLSKKTEREKNVAMVEIMKILTK